MKYLIVILYILIQNDIMSQDMSTMLNEAEQPVREYTKSTFKSTRVINTHSIETLGNRTLDFRITHHFGNLNTDDVLQSFFGLDYANIRLGLEYSYNGRCMIGIGRTKIDGLTDAFIKTRLLRQTTDNKMPVSLTWMSGVYYVTSKYYLGITDFKLTNRLQYAHQVIIARKFSEKFSLQVAPMLLYYNLVQMYSDDNHKFAILGASRLKITKRTAVTLEYNLQASKFSSNNGISYHNSAGIGFDIETGGHVFQLFFTNSTGIAETQFVNYTQVDIFKGNILIGFNISRVFKV
ncbi:MAG: DUF5777 family beta-barrel protein [Cytophagales bacterium]|nr:DUF5777 family beta-barrel protein [Cytophagales bacterium]